MPLIRNRTTPAGIILGETMAKLTEQEVAKLTRDEGEPDKRCRSCAFRRGTVPNGCPQTQMDALKAVMEHEPFHCHDDKTGRGKQNVCWGWFAAMQAVKDKPAVKCDWDFSPPDEELSGTEASQEAVGGRTPNQKDIFGGRKE